MEAAAKEGAEGMGKLSGAAGAAAGAIAGLLIVVAEWALIAKTVLNVSKLGDEIDKTSQKIGMSAEKFQLWRAVAEEAGIEASSFTNAVKKLNMN